MNVAVIGAGKMGLPIACQLASRGANVQACDVNASLVATINRGECPFEEPGLEALLTSAVANGTLAATTDTAAAIRVADVVIVIVPVLLTPDKRADLRQIHSVAKQIGQNMKPGAMVVFETTLPVGTTRSMIPMLESGGRRAGLDFDLVFSPERVKSQLVLKHLTETSKVVGGLTPAAAERAAKFYAEYLTAPVTNVGTLEASEFVKLAGMVYRDVNIALANEMARYADEIGVDLAPVTAASNSDGEAYLLTPGIGVGGHCTPVYPHFLIQSARHFGVPVPITELSRQINDEQPEYAISQLETAWQPVRGRRVLLLGLGFRPQVKEHTCSPAFPLRDLLQARGAIVELHDPMYSDDEIRAHGFVPAQLTAGKAPDAVVLVTSHREFADLDFAAFVRGGLEAVLDGRNLWNPDDVRVAGAVYVGIGRGIRVSAPAGVTA
jgi:nucleotide sugar dehydrogenase